MDAKVALMDDTDVQTHPANDYSWRTDLIELWGVNGLLIVMTCLLLAALFIDE